MKILFQRLGLGFLTWLAAFATATAQIPFGDPMAIPAIRAFLPPDGFGERHPDAPAEVEQFGQLVGIWVAAQEMRRQDGSWAEVGDALWVWRYALGGFATQDLWYQPADRLPAYLGDLGHDYLLSGTRIYSPAAGRWEIAWMANGLDATPGQDFGTFHATWQDDRLVMTSPAGSVAQRVTFSQFRPFVPVDERTLAGRREDLVGGDAGAGEKGAVVVVDPDLPSWRTPIPRTSSAYRGAIGGRPVASRRVQGVFPEDLRLRRNALGDHDLGDSDAPRPPSRVGDSTVPDPDSGCRSGRALEAGVPGGAVRAGRREVAMVAPIPRIHAAPASASVVIVLALSLSGCAGTNAERIELTSSPEAARPTATLIESVASSRADRDDPPRTERWGDRYWGTASSPLVRVEPVVAASAWVTVEEWAGETSTRTEVFDVRSEWTLVWRSGNRPIDEPLRIEARRFPGDEVVARISVDGQTPASSLHLNGQGQYYLSITGEGGGWYVAVELPGRDVPPGTVTPQR